MTGPGCRISSLCWVPSSTPEKGTANLITSGDSYTDTGFDPTGVQPNDTYPLGNPFTDSSTRPYHTFTNGPNWIEYLTFKYNDSQIDTYNLAIGGSTVDGSVFGMGGPGNLVSQIKDRFVPNYVRKNTVSWSASNSLFTLFFGINDVNLSWKVRGQGNNDAIFSSYMEQLEALYLYGARNFLLHNLPPIDRGPHVSRADAALEAPVINDFNYRMHVMFNQFTSNKEDVSVLLFNTNKLFSEAIDDPSVYPQTAIYKNTTGSCAAYEMFELPSMDYYSPSCEHRVNEYLWMDGLHPTYPMHEAIAAQVAIALRM
ncbi:MAG: hypothetical protein Q9174_003396 [Haloplaca sp. 1 TL-2023]